MARQAEMCVCVRSTPFVLTWISQGSLVISFKPVSSPRCTTLSAAVCVPPADTEGVLSSPEQWQLLADCYGQAGRQAAAVQLYKNQLALLGVNDERYGWDW